MNRQVSRTPSDVVVSVFDPASVGGGGPLRRITTQQKERAEQARRAAGLRLDDTAAKSSGRNHTTLEEEDVIDTKDGDNEDPDLAGTIEHVYPDGGYGWVVVGCCATLAGLTMGWGMNWGIFQTVSLGLDSSDDSTTRKGSIPEQVRHISAWRERSLHSWGTWCASFRDGWETSMDSK